MRTPTCYRSVIFFFLTIPAINDLPLLILARGHIDSISWFFPSNREAWKKKLIMHGAVGCLTRTPPPSSHNKID